MTNVEMNMHRSTRFVILSEQSEAKDLRTFRFASRHSVRRSFDFGLRPSLRMTSGAAAPNPSPGEKVAPGENVGYGTRLPLEGKPCGLSKNPKPPL